ncbi:hypothetical protein [Pseudomonas sp. TE24901]
MINSKEQLENVVEMFSFFQKNSPLSMGRYLDLQLPERHTDQQQAQYAQVLLDTFKLVDGDDLFDIDRPINEGSIIRGLSDNGKVACAMLLRMAAAKGIR